MSTKTSPTNVRDGSGVVTATTAAGVVQIKKELPSDEIKEFAQNTMNELLGWYGFDGVDRLDLNAKTSRLLQSAAAAAAASQQQQHHHQLQLQQQQQQNFEKKRSSRSRTASLLQQQQTQQSSSSSASLSVADPLRSINSHNSNNNNRKGAINCNSYRGGNVGATGGNESTTSDHDTRSSREDDSKSPHSAGKTTIEEKIDFNNCCWCHRSIPENAPEFLTTSDGPRYCSETCFAQSRRASFKKAKTCDWCKHVRHAVSYVDFQDGASQLQFCSEKCLNQYKMEIFCNETRAHLDMNPHLREQGMEAAAAGNGAGLITPDLWLRNCRSRSASPASTISVSPGPTPMVASGTQPSSALKLSSPCITPPMPSVAPPPSTAPSPAGERTKPMISVAPVAKLMSKSPNMLHSRPSPKHNRKKRPQRTDMTTAISGAVPSPASASSAVGIKSNAATVASLLKAKSGSPLMSHGNGSCLSHFAGSSVQDLHMSVPPLSPMMESSTSAPQQQQQHQLSAQPPQVLNHGRANNIPAAYFAAPPLHAGAPNATQPGSGFPPHRTGFLNAGMHPGILPRFMPGCGMPQLPLPPPPPLPQLPQSADVNSIAALLGAPPPVTVMVPYPIIIPLPIPIPVPLPVVDFYKAYMTPEQRKQYNAQQSASKSASNDEAVAKQETLEDTESEQPLDFTTTTKDTDTLEDIEVEVELKSTTMSTPERLPPTELIVSTTPSSELCKESTSEASSEPSIIETHCIVHTEDPLLPSNTSESRNVSDATEAAGAGHEGVSTPVAASDDEKQKLPKFKITRLQSKRSLLQTKESPTTSSSECSRPLRKRKRIIDCDFQKIALKDATVNDEEEESANNNNNSNEISNGNAEDTILPTATTSACNSANPPKAKKIV